MWILAGPKASPAGPRSFKVTTDRLAGEQAKLPAADEMGDLEGRAGLEAKSGEVLGPPATAGPCNVGGLEDLQDTRLSALTGKRWTHQKLPLPLGPNFVSRLGPTDTSSRSASHSKSGLSTSAATVSARITRRNRIGRRKHLGMHSGRLCLSQAQHQRGNA